jgi:hypothetical protein
MSEKEEEYWNIYCKYRTYNEAGMDITTECVAAVRGIMDKFHQYNPRDIQLIMADIAGGEAQHRVIQRANRMKEAEKEASEA